jgi:class 3 adenylate cyclase/tetratricopeptide (TPR) repeat protein
MELLADRDPEEARSILDPVLQLMMDAVHRYEGTVNQVMGDGIMALFGAPIAHEDHATRACYAALCMQESVKRYAEGARRRRGVFVQIRVGLNSGEVVVRAIGSDLRMDYSAVGQTTHLAARMEQAATPGSIFLTSATLASAEGFIEVKPLGPLPLKGIPQPVEIYEMIAASAVRSRFQAGTNRGLSVFVGRAPEMDALGQALDLAKALRGQVIGVVGDAGVGKSRLYYEFVRSHYVEDCLVVQTSSVSYGKATAYLPLLALLRGYFGVDGADPPQKVRETITGKLLSLDPSLEPFLAAFLWLLDVPVEVSGWQGLDAVQRRQLTLDGLKRLLIRESQIQPVVIVAEDLHWIDSETQAFLDAFVESVPTARVLLLVNYRPEFTHTWSSKTFYRQIRIDPLPPASAMELLDSLLGQDSSVQALKPMLVQRTDGTPFFLEECVRTLVGKGALGGEPGRRRLVQSVGTVDIPPTVSAILAARIDRLESDTKATLQAAAVIGKDVPFELLRIVVGGVDDQLRQHVSTLQAGEFLYERLVFPDLEYTFKHALTAEVAYGSLLQERRRELHGRVVRAIEQLHPDRVEEHAERLAYHARRGELWEEVVQYGRFAGKRAIARSAFAEGAQHLREALRALDHLGSSPARTEEAIELRLSMRAPLWQTGQLDEMLKVLREAEQMAHAANDAQRLDQVRVLLANVLWATGQHVEHRRLVPQLFGAATVQADPTIQLYALTQLANAQIVAGQFQAARDLMTSKLSTADAIPAAWSPSVTVPSIAFRSLLIAANGHMGNFEEAIQFGREALASARAVAKPVNEMLVADWLSWCYGSLGDLAASLELSDRAVTLSEHHGSTTMLVPALVQHGWNVCALGQHIQGLPFIERGLALAEAHRVLFFQSMWLVMLAQVHLWNRDPSSAEALARRALEVARVREEPPYQAWAYYVAGEAADGNANPSVPEAHYRQALALSEPRGMRPLVAHCHAGLAKLYWRRGNRQKAQEELDTAAAMYREMAMTYWLEKAEAEMKART